MNKTVLPVPEQVSDQPAQRAAAEPVTLGNNFALYQSANLRAGQAETAVLFVYPWGMEELGIRKFYRIIAEHLSDLGISSLRFDLPQTANSIDPGTDCNWSDWQNALRSAADALKRRSQCKKLILIGQATGASLALEFSVNRSDIGGLALLAPVMSGPAFLKELAALSRLATASNKTTDPDRAQTFDWATQIPPGIAADLSEIELDHVFPRSGTRILLVARPKRQTEQSYLERANQAGCPAQLLAFHGYEKLVKDLNSSQIPVEVVTGIVNWCHTIAGTVRNAPPVAAPISRQVLTGPNFSEEMLRLGTSNRLLAVVCCPLPGIAVRAVCILLTTAYHPMAGWGRINVDAARQLAAQGIVSIRFDAANAADSPPVPGIQDENSEGRVIWPKSREDDVTEVIACLKNHMQVTDPLIIAGRCSGAYLALIAALQNPEIKAAMLANTFRFDWKLGQPINNDLAFVPQPMSSYLRKLTTIHTWKRMGSGKINLYRGVININRAIVRRIYHRLGAKLGVTTGETRLIANRFRTLQERGAKVRLLYTRSDPGILQLQTHFGTWGRMLHKVSDADIEFLDNGDHNVSMPMARERFLYGILDLVSQIEAGRQGTD